jgi:hypothetical protein
MMLTLVIVLALVCIGFTIDDIYLRYDRARLQGLLTAANEEIRALGDKIWDATPEPRDPAPDSFLEIADLRRQLKASEDLAEMRGLVSTRLRAELDTCQSSRAALRGQITKLSIPKKK